MSRGRGRSRRLLLPLLLVLGAAALAAGLLLRREDRSAWPPAGSVTGAWRPGGAAATPASPPTATAAPEVAPAPGESVEDLLRLSRQELYARAQARDIPGRSRMSKRELAEALAARD